MQGRKLLCHNSYQPNNSFLFNKANFLVNRTLVPAPARSMHSRKCRLGGTDIRCCAFADDTHVQALAALRVTPSLSVGSASSSSLLMRHPSMPCIPESRPSPPLQEKRWLQPLQLPPRSVQSDGSTTSDYEISSGGAPSSNGSGSRHSTRSDSAVARLPVQASIFVHSFDECTSSGSSVEDATSDTRMGPCCDEISLACGHGGEHCQAHRRNNPKRQEREWDWAEYQAVNRGSNSSMSSSCRSCSSCGSGSCNIPIMGRRRFLLKVHCHLESSLSRLPGYLAAQTLCKLSRLEFAMRPVQSCSGSCIVVLKSLYLF